MEPIITFVAAGTAQFVSWFFAGCGLCAAYLAVDKLTNGRLRD